MASRERSLDKLDPKFRPFVDKFLVECRKQQLYVTVIETLRSEAQHQADLKNKVSWIKHSLHQDGLAMDVVPNDLLKEKGWGPDSPLWEKMGKIGEAVGMTWGGRWKQKDLDHFEYKGSK